MKSRAVLFLYTALAAFALAAALPGCGGKSSDAAKAPDARADAPVPVATVPVKVMPVQREVKFVGTLEAYEESAVSSNLAAPVARVYVDMGDRVVKGQTLAKLDDEEYRIKVRLAEAALREALAKLGVEDEESLVIEKVSYVKKAKAELDDAERSLGRMKELSGKGYVAKAQLDEAQARRDVAGAA
ncbi:MAG TPA: biotin/lipoyl-binding protein, partial [Nitrospirota bacterium]|nr:biotin/lipoyl-binding protein [Nitrospirota bacterium]